MPTPAINTLSLHDALPIYVAPRDRAHRHVGDDRVALADGDPEREWIRPGQLGPARRMREPPRRGRRDRKSTRLNSSHRCISYAVFCLEKKKWNSYSWSI